MFSKLIIIALLVVGCGGGSGSMSPYYKDNKVTCYKDYASGSVSCVKND